MSKLSKIFVNDLGREVFIRPGTVDETVLKDTFEGRYHIPPLKEEPKIVLDLGSNIGLTVAHYEVMWPNSIIYGYELDIENTMIARKNVLESTIFHIGIAAQDGMRGYSTKDASAYSIIDSGSTREAMCWSMDTIIQWTGPVDFIKMDIEGAELEIFQTDNRWSNIVKSILVEVHNGKIKEAWSALEALGYKCISHKPHWSAIWATKSI